MEPHFLAFIQIRLDAESAQIVSGTARSTAIIIAASIAASIALLTSLINAYLIFWSHKNLKKIEERKLEQTLDAHKGRIHHEFTLSVMRSNYNRLEDDLGRLAKSAIKFVNTASHPVWNEEKMEKQNQQWLSLVLCFELADLQILKLDKPCENEIKTAFFGMQEAKEQLTKRNIKSPNEGFNKEEFYSLTHRLNASKNILIDAIKKILKIELQKLTTQQLQGRLEEHAS